jgi:vacuolar-type H+-ATPase subunit H
MAALTSIAAGIGIASSLGGAAMSFSQANKQKKLQKEAEAEADKMMASARARLDVNYMDALSVQKEPYELQREAMVAQGAQTVDAAQESERGTAAAAGRVQMAQNEVQGGIRTAMGKELTEIERLKVAEESRLRDLQTQLDLGEVEGAQMAARNAAEMAAQATTQGWEGVTSAATQVANLVPLFPNLGGKEAVAGTLKNTTGIFPNPTPIPQTYKTPDWMSWANISNQNQGIFPNAGAQAQAQAQAQQLSNPAWLQWPYTPIK